MAAQVSPPSKLSVSYAPVVPIDITALSDAELEDPLVTLSDTAQVDVTVLIKLMDGWETISAIHFQIGSNENLNNVLDQELSIVNELPDGLERQGSNGMYSFFLGRHPYSGGLNVRARSKNVEGDYSVFLDN